MTLDVWMADRRRKAFKKAAFQAAFLVGLLACAVFWLAVREVGMPARALAARDAIRQEEKRFTRVTLKRLGMVTYLAKVRRNALLSDLAGWTRYDNVCANGDVLPSLPADSPCIVENLRGLRNVWRAGLGEHAPPTDHDMLYDAWGAPVTMVQVEYTCVLGNGWCPGDDLRSAGPDGVYYSPDDMVEFVMPFFFRHYMKQ